MRIDYKDKAVIEFKEGSILCVTFLDGAEIDLDDAIEMTKVIVLVCNNKPFLAFTDVRDVLGGASKEALNYFAHNEKLVELRVAGAILVSNLPMQILVKAYHMFSKPTNPEKVFSSEKDALEWLENYRDLIQ